MGRKLGMFGPRADVVAAASGVDETDHDDPMTPLPPAIGLVEQTLAVGSTDWTPEQTEQYIDWRLQALDSEIAQLRAQLEELTATRKRWLAVTGGRSKINGNGNGGVQNGASGV